ncbi:cell division protein FtsQ/DivIB [Tessaracoccus sp. ZS01]|uniref:cell division protein FtsQ/DivIB n=1 Tax=Tessaracoccus sp. ZS01 TaxID=1906324 RepID=UPI0009FB7E57|nr:FtsQ-type POTRA domain-containing protein [Tessaracoccus sp. ZS01]MCG6566183.1 cell division protein FtsQ [Tessaracoccus sp. ZS01]
MSEALTPGEFARALQDKRNAERRRRWWFRGGLAGALALVGLGVWLAFFSTVFAAQQVSVTGVSLLTTDQVVTAAEVSMGEPLLTQDLGAVTQRVNDLPAVRSAEVSRQLPDTVVIEVTERTAAFLRERDGQYDWIDEEGVAFHRTASPGPQDLPATVAVVEDQQRLLADVATVANHIPADVRPAVVSISAEAVDRISLALEGGRTVVWGSADESELKADVVSALLSVEATVYDVSAPGHPTTK